MALTICALRNERTVVSIILHGAARKRRIDFTKAVQSRRMGYPPITSELCPVVPQPGQKPEVVLENLAGIRNLDYNVSRFDTLSLHR
jgi:hypothetical protein